MPKSKKLVRYYSITMETLAHHLTIAAARYQQDALQMDEATKDGPAFAKLAVQFRQQAIECNQLATALYAGEVVLADDITFQVPA